MDFTAEGQRLEAADHQGVPWRRWGPYLSDRQWGTVREDYSDERRRVELLHPRPGALPGLPLGGGRHRRRQRRPAASVPVAGAMEPRRPDPQGAVLRPDQRGGQPRRGRQGVLLPSRQHPHPLLHAHALQVPAGRLSRTRIWWSPTGRAPAPSWSTSCSTPGCSPGTGTSTSRWSTPRPIPRIWSPWSRSPTGGPPTRRSTCCPASGSGTPGPGRPARTGSCPPSPTAGRAGS